MKKVILLALTLCLLLCVVCAAAGESEKEDLGDFVVGETSKLTGAFFTSMWGDNTSDIDVRHLLHGYSPIYWEVQPGFLPDSQIVHNLSVSDREDGGKLYIIEVYNDLSYSDGSPITAADYAFSYMLGASPVIAEIGGASDVVPYIAGYDAYHDGETNVFAGVRIFDAYTFGVDIDSAYLPFFYDLAYLVTYPYPISVIAPGCEVVDDGEGAYIRNIDPAITEPIFTAELLRKTILDPDEGYLSHPPVVSGPYTLTSYDAESGEARFNINPYFVGNWHGVVPTIDNVVLRPVLPETMMEELKNGDVQLLNKVVAARNITEGMSLMATGEVMSENYPRLGLGFIHYTCDNGVFTSQDVRQAVAYLIDTPELTREFTAGFGIPSYGYYGVGQWMYQALMGTLNDYILQSEEDAVKWEELAAEFSTLNTYDVDLGQAKRLLVKDGWTLNEDGKDYEEGSDTVRYKLVDGHLTPLTIRWGKLEGSFAAETLHEMITQPFADAGIQLEVDVLKYEDLMDYFYRTHEYKYDMLYLATNFISWFDPVPVFSIYEEHIGITNMTGYRDEELFALALDMRRTAPGDLYEYERKWVTFQKDFNEKLPLLPIYTNVYFDFHTPLLTGYYPNVEMSFPVALLSAAYGQGQGVTGDALEDDIIMAD